MQCPFAEQCWQLLHVFSPDEPLQYVLGFRTQLNVSFFMDLIILMRVGQFGWYTMT